MNIPRELRLHLGQLLFDTLGKSNRVRARLLLNRQNDTRLAVQTNNSIGIGNCVIYFGYVTDSDHTLRSIGVITYINRRVFDLFSIFIFADCSDCIFSGILFDRTRRIIFVGTSYCVDHRTDAYSICVKEVFIDGNRYFTLLTTTYVYCCDSGDFREPVGYRVVGKNTHLFSRKIAAKADGHNRHGACIEFLNFRFVGIIRQARPYLRHFVPYVGSRSLNIRSILELENNGRCAFTRG